MSRLCWNSREDIGEESSVIDRSAVGICSVRICRDRYGKGFDSINRHDRHVRCDLCAVGNSLRSAYQPYSVISRLCGHYFGKNIRKICSVFNRKFFRIWCVGIGFDRHGKFFNRIFSTDRNIGSNGLVCGYRLCSVYLPYTLKSCLFRHIGKCAQQIRSVIHRNNIGIWCVRIGCYCYCKGLNCINRLDCNVRCNLCTVGNSLRSAYQPYTVISRLCGNCREDIGKKRSVTDCFAVGICRVCICRDRYGKSLNCINRLNGNIRCDLCIFGNGLCTVYLPFSVISRLYGNFGKNIGKERTRICRYGFGIRCVRIGSRNCHRAASGSIYSLNDDIGCNYRSSVKFRIVPIPFSNISRLYGNGRKRIL